MVRKTQNCFPGITLIFFLTCVAIAKIREKIKTVKASVIMKNKQYDLKHAILNFCLHLAQMISHLRLGRTLNGGFAKWPKITRIYYLYCMYAHVGVCVLFYTS